MRLAASLLVRGAFAVAVCVGALGAIVWIYAPSWES